MKRIPIITGVIFLFTISAYSQDMDNYNFKGWEFLKWEYSKEQVEAVLKNKGFEYDPGSVNSKHVKTTLMMNGMKTILSYDLGHLYDIQQYRYFSVEEKDKADEFYETLTTEFRNKYGQDSGEKDNPIKKMNLINWELKFTIIKIYYSYNDDVMEGFEDRAFQILVSVNENK